MKDIDRRSTLALAIAAALSVSGAAAAAGLQDEVRAVFDHFIAAQNAHDADRVRETLDDTPDFLWITPRGETIRGREAALERFRAFHRGTWKIEPDMAQFRVWALGDSAAQLIVPLVLTVGPPDQPARPMHLLLNQTLVRRGSGWLIASILPVPVPTQ